MTNPLRTKLARNLQCTVLFIGGSYFAFQTHYKLALASSQQRPLVYLDLSGQNLITQENPFVSDFMTCIGDALHCARILGTQITLNLKPIQHQTIAMTRIQDEISKVNTSQIEIRFPETKSVEFKTTGSELSRQIVESGLKNVLRDKIANEKKSRLKVFKVRNFKSKKFFADNLRFEVDHPSWKTEFANPKDLFRISTSRSISISIFEGKSSKPIDAQKIYVTAEFDVKIPITIRNIPRKKKIGYQDIRVDWFPLNRQSQNALPTIKAIIGNLSSRSLSIYRSISEKDLLPNYVIKRGDIIDVVYDTGSMVIQKKARALDNATKNEWLRVSETKQKKILRAIATGKGKAKVKL